MLGFPSRSRLRSTPRSPKRKPLAQDEATQQGIWSDVGAGLRAPSSGSVAAGTAGKPQIHPAQSRSRSLCGSRLSSCHQILWIGESGFSAPLRPEAVFPPKALALRRHLNLQRHLASVCRPLAPPLIQVWRRAKSDPIVRDHAPRRTPDLLRPPARNVSEDV